LPKLPPHHLPTGTVSGVRDMNTWTTGVTQLLTPVTLECWGEIKFTQPEEPKKKCNTCTKHKPLSEYDTNHRTASGLKSSCKVCMEKKAKKL
jgi:hypothetical protein